VADLPGRVVDIRFRALLKVIAAAALVWLWLTVYPVVLIVLVAVLMAVTVNPVVVWLERKRWPRWAASLVVSGLLLVLSVGFFWMTWASLSAQVTLLLSRLDASGKELSELVPAWLRNIVEPNASSAGSYVASYGFRIAQSAVAAVGVTFLGFILMIYFLIEGRTTCEWLLAFVPLRHRHRAEQTLSESERVIVAYAVGNGITSVVAFAFTWLVLWWLQVPAALLLAVMAGLSDFIPVVGFVVSAVPAILLALTVSGTTALLVIGAYIVYNTFETYLLSPWAYGNRLNLSNLAIIIAFAVGAQVAGVIGALIALPVAALYPTVERLWLRNTVGEAAVAEHEALQAEAE
jgi:predicted PurR-regulated permease PerM